MEIREVLAQRGKLYGKFSDHALIAQRFKQVMQNTAVFKRNGLSVEKLEALEMIFHKIARILNGDPNYADSWIDIAGYAKLVADELEEDPQRASRMYES